jgi:outer membrane protein assembly factor BamB
MATRRPAARSAAVVFAALGAVGSMQWLPIPAAAEPAKAAPRSADWPDFLGPNGSGSAAPCEAPLIEAFADAKLVWLSEDPIPNGQAGYISGPKYTVPIYKETISGGYASPILHQGRVYLQYYVPSGDVVAESIVQGLGQRDKWRVEADDVLHCFDAKTGKTVWRKVLPLTTMNFNAFPKGGPSLTPCVSGNRLFMHSAGGRVFAFDAATGDLRWERKTARFDFQEKKRAEAKAKKTVIVYNRDFKTSPVVVDGILVFNDHRYHKTSAPEEHHYEQPSNLIGLDPESGNDVWRIVGGLANGSQPVRWPWKGREYLIARGWKENGIQCIEPRSGTVLWKLMADGPICVSGEYLLARGATDGDEKAGWHECFRISETGATKLWALDRAYGQNWAAAQGGFAYVETAPRGRLICIDLARGSVAGTAPAEKDSHFGYFPRILGHRILCGGGDTDQLHLYDADPKRFRLLDDAFIPNAWGYEMPILPALADGRMYLRTHDRLACIDLRRDAPEGTPLKDTPLLMTAAQVQAAQRGTSPAPPAGSGAATGKRR